MIDNVHATGAILTSSITGLPGFDVEDVTLSDIRIARDEAGKEDWVNREISKIPDAYPEARIFGRLPSFRFYCRHVNRLSLRDLTLTCATAEKRPAITCEGVRDLDIRSLRATGGFKRPICGQVDSDCRNAAHGLRRPGWGGTFLEAQGELTKRIVLAGCDLSGAQKPVEIGPTMPPGAVSFANENGKL
jgi:hypothetical protein